MKRTGFAPGKIILTGEYAVVFGYPGIAVPLPIGVRAEFEENPKLGRVVIRDTNDYFDTIVAQCRTKKPDLSGTLSVRTDIPIGKGVGASCATIIAIVRALLDDYTRDIALEIEGIDALDFAVIWANEPVIFQKGTPSRVFQMPPGLLNNAVLIDTGARSETTSELITWIKNREKEIQEALRTMGNCTERLTSGETLASVVHDNHRALVALGVVPPAVQELIQEIESSGGAGKITGAGGRIGGAGLVLALGDKERIRIIAEKRNMPIVPL